MTRIVFLDHSPIIGGAQLALAEHIRHLDRDRFEAHVVCGRDEPEMTRRFRDAGAAVHEFDWPRLRALSPLRVPHLIGRARALRRLVLGLRPDVVVANTSRTAYMSALALAGSGAHVVWWVRDFEFGRRVFRLLERSATRIVCVSHAIREFYGGTGDPRFDVVYVGSGLHARLAEIGAGDIAAERARWGLDASDLVVGYMGRLVEGKGPQDLVAAAERLAGEFPRLRVLIVGTGRGQTGDNERALHDLVAARGLEPIVRFAGFQSNEALYYRLFDVFVLTSRYREAMPTSAIQAMMAETPVVATNTGGTPEVVVDGETGLLVPPANPDALAAAIGRVLRDPGLARRLTEAGAARTAAAHREERVSAQLMSIYELICAN
ncbi:MAG TPA: glycosyltransferase family 4 protein [Gemmatimonadaceae bacterium]|nr:glycosyltransferase family 4 protein [Gemmatimonadaceae bacterium]